MDTKSQLSIVDPFNSKTWTDDSTIYFENVDAMLLNPKEYLFSNDRLWHALYLIAKFFECAKDNVRIFSGKLTRKSDEFGLKIYENPNVVEAVCGFLAKPNTQLNIVVQDEIDVDVGQDASSHPLIKEVVASSPKGRLTLCKANKNSLDKLRQHNMLRHMMIVDRFAWRLEFDSSAPLVKADVGIGDESLAKQLGRLFDEVLFRPGRKLLESPAVGASN